MDTFGNHMPKYFAILVFVFGNAIPLEICEFKISKNRIISKADFFHLYSKYLIFRFFYLNIEETACPLCWALVDSLSFSLFQKWM